MNLKHIVTKDTLYIESLDYSSCKVYEKNCDFICRYSIDKVVDDSCLYYGSSMKGRIKASKGMLGSPYKVPIIISETKKIIVFFIKSKNKKYAFLSENVEKCSKVKGGTYVYFVNNSSLFIEISFNIFEKQFLKANLLRNILEKRENK